MTVSLTFIKGGGRVAREGAYLSGAMYLVPCLERVVLPYPRFGAGQFKVEQKERKRERHMIWHKQEVPRYYCIYHESWEERVVH